jgi:hypothetical protein
MAVKLAVAAVLDNWNQDRSCSCNIGVFKCVVQEFNFLVSQDIENKCKANKMCRCLQWKSLQSRMASGPKVTTLCQAVCRLIHYSTLVHVLC